MVALNQLRQTAVWVGVLVLLVAHGTVWLSLVMLLNPHFLLYFLLSTAKVSSRLLILTGWLVSLTGLRRLMLTNVTKLHTEVPVPKVQLIKYVLLSPSSKELLRTETDMRKCM